MTNPYHAEQDIILGPGAQYNINKSIAYARAHPEEGFPWAVSSFPERWKQILKPGRLMWIYCSGSKHFVILGKVREFFSQKGFGRKVGWEAADTYEHIFFMEADSLALTKVGLVHCAVYPSCWLACRGIYYQLYQIEVLWGVVCVHGRSHGGR